MEFKIGEYNDRVLCDVVEMDHAICFLGGHGNMMCVPSMMAR